MLAKSELTEQELRWLESRQYRNNPCTPYKRAFIHCEDCSGHRSGQTCPMIPDYRDAAEFEACVAKKLAEKIPFAMRLASVEDNTYEMSAETALMLIRLDVEDEMEGRIMTPEQERFILGTAANVYGINLQFKMLSEECGELLSVANKYLRGRVKVEDLIEEVIDVQIMCEQVFILVGCTVEKAEVVRKRKLERLHERLLKREKAMSQAVLEDEQ